MYLQILAHRAQDSQARQLGLHDSQFDLQNPRVNLAKLVGHVLVQLLKRGWVEYSGQSLKVCGTSPMHLDLSFPISFEYCQLSVKLTLILQNGDVVAHKPIEDVVFACSLVPGFNNVC